MSIAALTKQPIEWAIPHIKHPTSTAERWVSYVLGACKVESDPRTLSIWAHAVAVSYTTLCETCRLIDVQPRHARDFARVLRVILRPSFHISQLPSLLDISDRRTLQLILHNAGFNLHTAASSPISVVAFFDHQRFIDPGNVGLTILRGLFNGQSAWA